MNNPLNKPIVDFINDFKLIQPDGLICFNAKVLFIINDIQSHYECEVTIVTIKPKELDAIYLLNSKIHEDGLDDMFTIKNEKIGYIQNNGLIIKRDDNFKVLIFPLNQNCDDNKVTENLIEYLKTH